MRYENNIHRIIELERELNSIYDAKAEKLLIRSIVDAMMYLARADEQEALDECLRNTRFDLLRNAAFADRERRRADG
jgi:hypothetical protein